MTDSPTFLETVAAHVLEHHDPRNVTVVLPSQRAAQRFQAHFARLRGGQPGWLPMTDTLNGLLRKAVGLTPLTSMEALARLYLAHKTVPRKQGAEKERGGFAAFLQWGRLALQDFNELDQYRCNVNEVLTNLCDIKELDHWNVDDAGQLSEAQQRYLEQYMRLHPIYMEFHRAMREDGVGTGGSIARAAADRGDAKGMGHVVLAGMAALTPAEMGYLERLQKEGLLTVFADADDAYVQPGWEAGEFIAEQQARLPMRPLSSRLAKAAPRLKFVGCSTRVFECQYVRHALNERIGSGESLEDTVVVLPDGRTLSMLMQSLDLGDQRVNITMGLSWTESPVVDYLELVFQMVLREGKAWRHDEVRALLSHPISKALGGERLQREAGRFLGQLARRHWVWIGERELAELKEGAVKGLLERLRPLRVEEPGAFLGAMETWSGEVMAELDALGDAHDPWLRAAWRPVVEALGVCARFQAQHAVFEGRREVRDLAFQVLNQERIDLRGEPDQGLQIMGIIETRAIDFKRVVVLDCNEGTLPKTSRADSFIPFDLRAALNLPNRHRKEAIYAHYLYRLLNRAEEVVLVYLKDDGEHEPSRYLKQLEHAFAPGGRSMEVVHETVEAELPAARPEIRDIEWTAFAEAQTRKWAASGMSPSALNTLMECPRNFYYTYIMKMREQDQVEETLSASQFGSVVHQVFEWGLAAAKDRPIVVEDLQRILDGLEPLLDRAVAQWYNPALMAVGENRIARKLAEETARALVEQEIQELQSGVQRTLRGLEMDLHARVGDLAFRGKADRVDIEGGIPVVIDYKSGKVEPGDVKLSAKWEEQLSAGKRPKALQLLVYAAIALRGMNANGTLPSPGEPLREAPRAVRAGIRSGRRARAGLLELDWEGVGEVTLEQSEAFIHWVAAQLESLYLGERAIAHNEEQRFCPYCVVLDPQANYF